MQRQNLYRVSRSLGQKRAGIDNMLASDLEWTSLEQWWPPVFLRYFHLPVIDVVQQTVEGEGVDPLQDDHQVGVLAGLTENISEVCAAGREHQAVG